MKVELRTASGHLIGDVPVPDRLMKTTAVVFPLSDTGESFAQNITLPIAEWHDIENGIRRRVLKVPSKSVPLLRRISGFWEDPGFRHYDKLLWKDL